MKATKFWIARDNDGRVFIHTGRPKRNTLGGGCYISYPYGGMIDVSGTEFENMLDKSGKTILEIGVEVKERKRKTSV